jgi:histidine kinase/DNA gyrase B/HSP90-like ATPase
LQCGHGCFRQRWRARIFIFILRRSDRAHHPSPSAAVAACNSSTVSVQAAPTRADRIGKTCRVRPPACARCRGRRLADRPRCDRALKFWTAAHHVSVPSSAAGEAKRGQPLPAIQGDRVQLQQVILNLMVNAAEAISGTSDGLRELVISTARTDLEEVLVAVRDSGPGLPPESVDRLFGSFYTTKPDGLGMGLSICRSIIEAHRRRLWATANTPHGAVFQFMLPRYSCGEKDDR